MTIPHHTTCDYVLVRIDKELNDDLAVIKDENGNDIPLKLNPNFNPTHHAKICAEVVAVPEYLSGRDYPLYENHPGSPRPLSYRSGESIQKAMAALPPKYRKHQQAEMKAKYQPGGHTPDMITHFGTPVDVRIGDTVYFHYNCLITDTNFWGYTEDYQLIYKIHYSQLFCVVDPIDGSVLMLNNYVLVSEYFDDDIRDIDIDGLPVKAKLKGNLVIQIHEKPRYLLGVVQHIGVGIGPDVRRQSLVGEVVLYMVGSEFENTIEGKKYWVMRQNDLVAVYCDAVFHNPSDALNFNVLKPIGDYLMVMPDQPPVSNKVEAIVWDQTKENQEFKPGQLFVLPSAVSQTKKTKKWGAGHVIGQGELVTDSWLGEKVMYEKSSFYMYAEEWKRAFVKYGDLYGNFLTEVQ